MISYHPQSYVIVNDISVIVNLCILYVETISQELSSGTQKTSIELLISLQTQMSYIMVGTNKTWSELDLHQLWQL